MTGKRLPDGEKASWSPGDYWKDQAGSWTACTPSGLLAGLAKHSVLEHEDGTITVSPSILVRGTIGVDPRKLEWHGFLEHGVWRSC